MPPPPLEWFHDPYDWDAMMQDLYRSTTMIHSKYDAMCHVLQHGITPTAEITRTKTPRFFGVHIIHDMTNRYQLIQACLFSQWFGETIDMPYTPVLCLPTGTLLKDHPVLCSFWRIHQKPVLVLFDPDTPRLQILEELLIGLDMSAHDIILLRFITSHDRTLLLESTHLMHCSETCFLPNSILLMKTMSERVLTIPKPLPAVPG